MTETVELLSCWYWIWQRTRWVQRAESEADRSITDSCAKVFDLCHSLVLSWLGSRSSCELSIQDRSKSPSCIQSLVTLDNCRPLPAPWLLALENMNLVARRHLSTLAKRETDRSYCLRHQSVRNNNELFSLLPFSPPLPEQCILVFSSYYLKYDEVCNWLWLKVQTESTPFRLSKQALL